MRFARELERLMRVSAAPAVARGMSCCLIPIKNVPIVVERARNRRIGATSAWAPVGPTPKDRAGNVSGDLRSAGA